MTLDLRSLIALTTALMVVMAVMLLMLRRSLPRGQEGLGHWIGGLFTLTVAGVLLTGRGLLPDLLSIVIANIAMVGGTLWVLTGVRVFFGEAPRPGFWLAVMGIGFTAFTWFTFMQPMTGVRTVLLCAMWSGVLLTMARTVWRHAGARFGGRFTAGILLLEGTMVAVRGLTALQSQTVIDLLNPTPVQTAYVVINAVATVALPMGLVLMALERLRDELTHRATHDALTGVLSRGPIIEHVETEIARARRTGRSLSVCLLDIDHFKSVNDTYGHQTGDRVLVRFARRVGGSLRPYDRLGRYGGEEFLVLLPEADSRAGTVVAQRILKAVSQPAEEPPDITTSAGLAELRADDTSADALLARADAALYAAKAAGRNQVVVA